MAAEIEMAIQGSRCRICMLSFEDDEETLNLGCQCPNSEAHHSCTLAWFGSRQTRTCELCRSEAVNLSPHLLDAARERAREAEIQRRDRDRDREDETDSVFADFKECMRSCSISLGVVLVAGGILYLVFKPYKHA